MTQKLRPELSGALIHRIYGIDRKQLESPPVIPVSGSGDQEPPTTKGYKGLFVWQRSIEMVDGVYVLTAEFPATERFGLTAQMRRAAVSVPSNIAEGYGRQSTGEFRQFLGVARGSNCELETQIIIARRRGFGSENRLANAERLNAAVSRLLWSYMRSLDGKREQ